MDCVTRGIVAETYMLEWCHTRKTDLLLQAGSFKVVSPSFFHCKVACRCAGPALPPQLGGMLQRLRLRLVFPVAVSQSRAVILCHNSRRRCSSPPEHPQTRCSAVHALQAEGMVGQVMRENRSLFWAWWDLEPGFTPGCGPGAAHN